MLVWMLVATASANTIDLQLTLGIAGESTTLEISDLDTTDSATIHLTQRFGKRDFDIDLVVSERGDERVSVESTVAFADTHEVVGSPQIETDLGTEASIEQSHGPRRLGPVDSIRIRVLATPAANGA